MILGDKLPLLLNFDLPEFILRKYGGNLTHYIKTIGEILIKNTEISEPYSQYSTLISDDSEKYEVAWFLHEEQGFTFRFSYCTLTKNIEVKRSQKKGVKLNRIKVAKYDSFMSIGFYAEENRHIDFSSATTGQRLPNLITIYDKLNSVLSGMEELKLLDKNTKKMFKQELVDNSQDFSKITSLLNQL